MTHAEIRAAITASPELTALVRTDTQSVADALSAGRVRRVERMIGVGSVLNALGPIVGAAMLDQVRAVAETDAVVKYGWMLLESASLDVGLDSTRAMLDALLPVEAATVLKGLAEVPDTVTVQDVLTAMEGI